MPASTSTDAVRSVIAQTAAINARSTTAHSRAAKRASSRFHACSIDDEERRDHEDTHAGRHPPVQPTTTAPSERKERRRSPDSGESRHERVQRAQARYSRVRDVRRRRGASMHVAGRRREIAPRDEENADADCSNRGEQQRRRRPGIPPPDDERDNGSTRRIAASMQLNAGAVQRAVGGGPPRGRSRAHGGKHRQALHDAFGRGARAPS